MTVSVIGAGAFGTSLAIALSRKRDDVMLWGRDAATMDQIGISRTNPRLPDVTLPKNLVISVAIDIAFAADILLLALPAQHLRPFLTNHQSLLAEKSLIACCKGIDLQTMQGPVETIANAVPTATAAILTGPSFAIDIARDLPTALTLAVADDAAGQVLQHQLSTQNLRIYRTTDTIGATLGGALKNVIAIACGTAMGAGLGESARAALMTRGFAEMARLAEKLHAHPTTLMGLSGFGDLVLTCTSDKSRNYRRGLALGQNIPFDATTTVEGASTAIAIRALARQLVVEMPICTAVADLLDENTSVASALSALLSRPLKEE